MLKNDLVLMTMEQLQKALALAIEDNNDIIQFLLKKEIKSRQSQNDGPSVA